MSDPPSHSIEIGQIWEVRPGCIMYYIQDSYGYTLLTGEERILIKNVDAIIIEIIVLSGALGWIEVAEILTYCRKI